MKQEKGRVDQPYRTVCYSRLCGIDELAEIIDESEDRLVIHGDVVYEKISPEGIRVDTDAVPDHVRDDLAAATLSFVMECMRCPEIREKMDIRMREKRGE